MVTRKNSTVSNGHFVDAKMDWLSAADVGLAGEVIDELRSKTRLHAQ